MIKASSLSLSDPVGSQNYSGASHGLVSVGWESEWADDGLG